MIEDGKKVSLEYTLALEDGTEVQSNVGEDPLVYEHGNGEILPALERELDGMAVEDTKQVSLQPDQAYGAVNPEAFQDVAADAIPEDARRQGALLVAEDEQGNKRTIRVHEVHDDRVVIDLNHPLAGKALQFDVKVVAVD